jgi:hypothetical protein
MASALKKSSVPSPLAPPSAGDAATLAVVGLLVLALTISPIIDYDLFLHLKTGALVLETGRVPVVDDYSALARGRPFVAHEWLSGVIFRLIERGFGDAGFRALTCLVTVVSLLMAAALHGAARSLGASPLLAVPMLAFVLVLAAARLVVRPQIFSYLLTAVFLWLLARRQAGRRAPLWAFLPLQVAWANLHGAFLLGPAIVALAAAGEWVGARLGLATAAMAAEPPPAVPQGPVPPRTTGASSGPASARSCESVRLAVLAAALLAACLLNPYGPRLLGFPFHLTRSGFMEEIYEWRPPFASSFAQTYMALYYALWIILGAGVILGVLLLSRRRRALPPCAVFGLLLFGLLLSLSLRMNRAVTDFALATFPGLAAGLSWLLRDRLDRLERGAARLSVRLATIAALIGLALFFAGHGYPWRPGDVRPFGFGIIGNTPVLAADYLKTNGVRGNIFNTYGTGPYLIYRLYPAIRVAMDSRNDVYGEDLYAEYKKALGDPSALRAMLDRLDAAAVILDWVGGRNLPTARLLRKVGPWIPVHFDDAAIVYMRAGGDRGDLVARDSYALLDPAGYRPGTLGREDAARALREADRAVRASRGSSIALVMRIDALLALDRRDEAGREEARLLAANPALPYIFVFLGDIHMAHGNRAAAAARYRQALRLSPNWRRAEEGLHAALSEPVSRERAGRRRSPDRGGASLAVDREHRAAYRGRP